MALLSIEKVSEGPQNSAPTPLLLPETEQDILVDELQHRDADYLVNIASLNALQ